MWNTGRSHDEDLILQKGDLLDLNFMCVKTAGYRKFTSGFKADVLLFGTRLKAGSEG